MTYCPVVGMPVSATTTEVITDVALKPTMDGNNALIPFPFLDASITVGKMTKEVPGNASTDI